MTHLLRYRKLILGLGLAVLILAAGLAVQQVLAGPTALPPAQASPIHPTFALLDAKGLNVLESADAVSTIQTCGQCHDAEFITSHSFHSDLGLSESVPAGQTASSRPWDTSPGLYGKWNPLTYRYLSPEGDSRVDLDNPAWTEFFANRVAGGGPAAESGVEMNCFLCHFTQPNNTERIAAIRAGKGGWAATATLLGSGLVERAGDGYQWNPAAFSETGELQPAYVTIQDPSNQNCGQCHGLVHSENEMPLTFAGISLDNWQTASTGQVVSPQKISSSGVNLADKAGLDRAWDIHAERGLKCTDCHYSLNNPAYYQSDADDRPAHLQYDPRRLELGEYLQKPDHNFARGQSAQFTLAAEGKGSMRRCEACHDAQTHASWLPYTERHMDRLACETCHIPTLYAPAIQSVDWTTLQADGQPLTTYRGVEGSAPDSQVTGTLNDLVTGFQPVLLERTDTDGHKMLAPYNLISSWYWVYDDPNGVRPVRQEDLQAAWFSEGSYHPDVLLALDSDGDGQLSHAELAEERIEKQQVIAARLASLGLSNPRIEGEVQPYSINHNVAGGEWTTRDCQDCHNSESRLAAGMILADSLPGGVMPTFVQDANVQPSSGITSQDGALYYDPALSDDGYYVFGHSRIIWVDLLGALFFAGVLITVGAHGTLRFVNAMRKPRPQPAVEKVYMYHVYERFWHWLQTMVIFLLLFTGLIIHRPAIFGFMSFRYMVTLHNVLAFILLINAGLSLFYHLASGEIRQYIPRPYGFFDQAIVQAKYYLQGIFKGGGHPFEKTPQKKLNPLQQITYFGILNVLLPLEILTGLMMWSVQRYPLISDLTGGLPILAPIHSLVAWTFASFIVAHVYLTTTSGYQATTGIKAMINGWEEVETGESHLAESPAAESPLPNSPKPGAGQPEAVPAD